MGKEIKKSITYKYLLGVITLLLSTSLFYSTAQYYKSELKAPAPAQSEAPKESGDNKKRKKDNSNNGMNFPIKHAAPQSYEELLYPQETPIDLRQPKNIESHAEYDPITCSYIIRTKVGDREIITPFIFVIALLYLKPINVRALTS